MATKKYNDILAESPEVSKGREEIEKAIEVLKKRVRVDATQLENKQVLGGISPHSPKTIIYTANLKGSKELLVLKEVALSPYRFPVDSPDAIKDIQGIINEIDKELEVVQRTKHECIADIKGIYLVKDIDPYLETYGNKEPGIVAKLKEAQKTGKNSFIDQKCVCYILGIVSRLYDGGDLLKYAFKENPTLPIKLQIILDAAEGMKALHAQKIFHRDFKPEQVFVSKNPDAKGRRAAIADFGMSKTLLNDEKLSLKGKNEKDPLWSPVMTLGVGTSLYQPKEQDEFNMGKVKSIDFYKADVWSFGFIFWALFVKDSEYENYSKRGGTGGPGIPPNFTVCSSDMPKEAKDLMVKCFSAKPEDRPDFNTIVSVMTKVVAAHKK